MQQAGVCCRPAGAGRSSGGTRTGRRHRFSSRFEAISRALQPGSKHAQPGVRTSTCTCTYNRWVWGGIKKKICRIRPLLLCGCVVHLLNYHWAGYEENLIVEKKIAPPHHVELAVESIIISPTPTKQTDVATDAPRRDREVNADCVLFGGVHRLKCAWNRGSIGRHKGGGYGPRPRAHAGICGWAHALARMS